MEFKPELLAVVGDLGVGVEIIHLFCGLVGLLTAVGNSSPDCEQRLGILCPFHSGHLILIKSPLLFSRDALPAVLDTLLGENKTFSCLANSFVSYLLLFAVLILKPGLLPLNMLGKSVPNLLLFLHGLVPARPIILAPCFCSLYNFFNQVGPTDLLLILVRIFLLV